MNNDREYMSIQLEQLCKQRLNNLRNEVYKNSLDYLTTTRGLTLDTLQQYKVGLDTTQFSDVNGHLQMVHTVAFPMFTPRSSKSRKHYR